MGLVRPVPILAASRISRTLAKIINVHNGSLLSNAFWNEILDDELFTQFRFYNIVHKNVSISIVDIALFAILQSVGLLVFEYSVHRELYM